MKKIGTPGSQSVKEEGEKGPDKGVENQKWVLKAQKRMQKPEESRENENIRGSDRESRDQRPATEKEEDAGSGRERSKEEKEEGTSERVSLQTKECFRGVS